MKIRNQWVLTATTIVVAAACLLIGQRVFAQNVLFDDTFVSGSTLDSGSPALPTGGSTDYELLSSKTMNTSSGLTSGNLTISLNASTSSGAGEMEALFGNDGLGGLYSIQNVGDWIQLAITFKEWGVIGNGNGPYKNASQLNIGLYNSHGSSPYAGGPLSAGGVSNSAGSQYATGGSAPWSGYVGKINAGGTYGAMVRGAQTGAGTASGNQEMLFNNAWSGSYNNPTGASWGTGTGTISMSDGGVYVDVLNISLQAGGLQVIDSLNAGSISGTPVISFTAITNGISSASFDALAFGFYVKSTNMVPIADITQIAVTSDIPEPSTWMLVGTGLAIMGGLIRRRRS